MLHKLSTQLAEFLIKNGQSATKKEIYIYGAECFFNLIICDSILFLYAFWQQQLPQFLLWLVCFSILRTHIGGYHAHSHATCIIGGILLGILCLKYSHIILFHKFTIYLILGICFLFLLKHSPVISPTHPISIKHKRKEHYISLIFFVIELVGASIFWNHKPTFSAIILTSMLEACFFSILGFIKYYTYQH